MIAGLLAIAVPFFAGVAASVYFGCLVLFAGVAHLVYAWSQRKAGAILWQILIGIVYLAAAFYMLALPVAGVVALTLVLAFYIAIEGVFELVVFSLLRKLPGSAPAIAWASLFLCLASLPQRMRRLYQQTNRSVLLTLLLITSFLSVSGCSSSPAKPNPPTPISTPGTPSGPQSVTITAADTAGGPSHSTNIQFTIQ